MDSKTNSKQELSSYLNSLCLVLLLALTLGLPVLFLTSTTDFFTLPKQILTGSVVLVTIAIFGIKMIAEKAVRIRRTVFDLPLILLISTVFLSSALSVNRFDSLIAFVPFLFAALIFFVIVNFVRSQKSFLLLIGALGAGAAVASIISILSYLKIHILPFPFTQTQTFTLIGSLLDQAVYLALLIPIAIVIASPKPSLSLRGTNEMSDEAISRNNGIAASASWRTRNDNSIRKIGFLIVSIILIIGLLITIYQLFTPPSDVQRTTILPFQTGFQTGFAAFSQDTQRSIQAFLFGSGYGTYLTDFTRFKLAAINQSDTLWSLSFVRSSSFALELLATTGILGILSFLFLIIRAIKNVFARSTFSTNPISISLILSIIALLALPVGFTVQALFFILLGLFCVSQGFRKEEQKRFFDIEFQLVALKKGLLSFGPFTPSLTGSLPTTHQEQKDASMALPIILTVFIFILVGALGFFSIRYLISDIEFQSSLVAASQNEAVKTYQKQNNAISLFPYRDSYYRIFSQTNLAIANSLANQQTQTATPSAETQQTVYTLIQQSINAGRSATTISPLTSLNWQNLSSIYRNLIGFGQNAEDFAIVTQQQAILLDPNNPQGYILLGGIYYQLGLWDNAQNQFQIAINLKPNFANARYNLGHTLENKGDLQNALREYEIVRNLVANDKDSLALITAEVEALKSRIEGSRAPSQTVQEGEETTTPPLTTSRLNLSTPSAQLPPQTPPVEIPAPEEIATESAQ